MRLHMRAQVIKASTTHQVVQKGKYYYCGETMLFCSEGGDPDTPNTPRKMFNALYDLVMTHDEYKKGDIFKTPFGDFQCEGAWGVSPLGDLASEMKNPKNNLWVCILAQVVANPKYDPNRVIPREELYSTKHPAPYMHVYHYLGEDGELIDNLEQAQTFENNNEAYKAGAAFCDAHGYKHIGGDWQVHYEHYSDEKANPISVRYNRG